MAQQVRFCKSFDGVRIAYASDGAGPPLVRTTFYLNHLELDWACPVWKPYLDELTQSNPLLPRRPRRLKSRSRSRSRWCRATLAWRALSSSESRATRCSAARRTWSWTSRK